MPGEKKRPRIAREKSFEETKKKKINLQRLNKIMKGYTAVAIQMIEEMSLAKFIDRGKKRIMYNNLIKTYSCKPQLY